MTKLGALIVCVALAGCAAREKPGRRVAPADRAVAGEMAEAAPAPPPFVAMAAGPEVAGDTMVFGGLPESTSQTSAFTLLENIGFVAGYSDTMKNPLWAGYRVFPVDSDPGFPRPGWHTDDRTAAQISDDCYVQDLPGNHADRYDRGHMAPNHAIMTRYGQDAQKETFALSNVCPQLCGLNREPWQGLEALIGGDWGMVSSNVWVMVGPIFSENPDVLGDCEIPIPDGFFQIIVEKDLTGEPRVLSVVMAQEDTGATRKLSEFITTVDCIEKLTRLDFFPDLPNATEDVLEASSPDADWNLDQKLTPSHFCAGGGSDAIALGNAKRGEILAKCGP